MDLYKNQPRVFLKSFIISFIILITFICIPLYSEAKTIKARYSGWAPPPSFVGQVEKRFFDSLHRKVGDKLQVELFQGGTLYKYQEVQMPLRTGAVEIISLTSFTLFEWAPEFKPTILTGAWDVDTLRRYTSSSDFAPAWKKLLKVSNSIPFGFHPVGNLHLLSSKPLSSTADFKGFRLESGNFEMIDIIKALGGSGGTLPVYEIYTALQQGMYDGAIGTAATSLGFGWAEFLRYFGKQPWSININWFLVNKDWWESLPKDVQDAFEETSREITDWALNTFADSETGYVKALEEKWKIQYFTLNDWDNIVRTAEEKVWPAIRKQVGSDFFDAAMRYTLLNKN
ncbi:MAG: TRAP transporter substrate-binding protein DctP [Deltaproteobacteria bacterium]|nr:TRAP transporter substrate-binding protein DctP [Deltaproteobacteria bacterium]